MLYALALMLTCLLTAGAVAAYLAYPRRGLSMPVAPQVGEALARGVGVLPTLQNRRE